MKPTHQGQHCSSVCPGAQLRRTIDRTQEHIADARTTYPQCTSPSEQVPWWNIDTCNRDSRKSSRMQCNS
eukprot:13699129-Heterocapsa_arctica.AAC.1